MPVPQQSEAPSDSCQFEEVPMTDEPCCSWCDDESDAVDLASSLTMTTVRKRILSQGSEATLQMLALTEGAGTTP